VVGLCCCSGVFNGGFCLGGRHDSHQGCRGPRVSRVETESTMALASAHGKAEDLAQRISHLKGELAEACQPRDMAELSSWILSDMAADVEQRLEEYER
jgi:hypothetical protein